MRQKMQCVKRCVIISGALALLLGAAGQAAHAETPTREVILRQPVLTGVAQDFVIPLIDLKPTPLGVFQMVLWQKSPYRPDGYTVPVHWDARTKTGLHVGGNENRQTGYADRPGTTIAQIAGAEVGAYLNSSDFEPTGRCDKMMVTPAYKFTKAEQRRPFAAPGGAVQVSLDLQVPSAESARGPNSRSYVSADLEFTDPVSHVKISNGVNLFFNHFGGKGGPEIPGFDGPSHSYMMNTTLYPTSSWVKPLPDSALQSGTTWTGYRNFTYEISGANLRRAIAAIKMSYPDAALNPDPAQYELTMFHLNAEIQCAKGHAELGWSMKGLEISVRHH